MKIKKYVVLAFTDEGECRVVARPRGVSSESFSDAIATLVAGFDMYNTIRLGQKIDINILDGVPK